jgi:hypothetical protein
VVPVATAGAAKVKAPRSNYAGTTEQKQPISLSVDRSNISIIAIRFACEGDVTGNTSAQDIKVKKTKRGYSFSIKTYGIASYSDGQGDDNAAINISGRFSPSAKSVKGTVKVGTHRCGSTGTTVWSARRSR